MEIAEYNGGKKVALSRALDSRAKILDLFYFACITITLYVAAPNLLDDESGIILGMIFLLLGVCYLIAAYRFLNKAVKSETLILNNNTLTIIKSGFLFRTKRAYDLKQIHQLNYHEAKKMTDHPLAGKSFDYFGFQGQQSLINELHGSEKVSFEYNGKTVCFGEHVYSWDFEQLEVLFKTFAGPGFVFNEHFGAVYKLDTEQLNE
jgi:hypothetical protein